MSKFNLFSRASFHALAAGVGLAAPVAEGGKPDGDGEDDAEAGPLPGDPPAEDPAALPAAASAQALPAAEVVLVSDAAAVAEDRFQAGRQQERARTAAVLGSEAGQANMAMAAWMLENNPDATAQAINTRLGTMPAGASTAAAEAIPDTEVSLGRGDAAAALAAGGTATDGDKIWADVQGQPMLGTTVIGSDASRATLAAIAAGAQIVQANGAPASAPAVPPTGN